jgi:hypothetical protein
VCHDNITSIGEAVLGLAPGVRKYR